MKKTTDEELNAWRYRYPSAGVSWNLTGDPVYCQQFVGEAKNMLYRLKNRMNIAVPKLKSLQDIRHYDGGTVITVRSIFGQDFIEIVAGRGFPSCLIKLLDLPLVIPPMKWYAPGLETWEKVDGAWIIKAPGGEVEVEGVDYIKTYFSWITRDCPACAPVEFTVAKGEDANILTGSSPNRPFWYESENDDGSLIYDYEGAMVPHFMGHDWTDPPTPPNPLNHTIYSLWGCQAQIIKNGTAWSFKDAGGSYFLWKAYTEWSNVGPQVVDFSRTGLGYMLMQAFIKDKGINLCETDGTIIKVDCCLKPVEERDVILYWESISNFFACGPTCGGQPFMFYGSIKICEVPDVVSTSLYYMLCTPRCTQTFYTIPGIKGGCLPFTWELGGYGGLTLTPSKPFGEFAGLAYECSLGPPPCQIGASITVTDRCGARDTFRFLSCCESGPAPVSISYTSLQMACSGQQTLEAWGGCGPYSWSASSGTIEPSVSGASAIYTAPASNAQCTQNPTISLTDCCGNSAEVKLAVNCWAGNQYSLDLTTCNNCNTCNPAGPEWQDIQREWHQKGWNCLGVMTKQCDIACKNHLVHKSVCPNPPFLNCNTGDCGCCNTGCQSGVLYDCRTQAMKDGGCCPINPLTGLPY